MNHNASTVDYIIFRIFIQTPTNENSASALSQMMGVCRRLPDGCFPPTPETGALCTAGPHGSTLQDRLATRAAGVARGKAAQAGLRQTVTAAPAQAAVQLWTPGAKSLTRSEAGTLAQSQRYGARGRCTRPGVCMWLVWRWQRCAMTLVYSCLDCWYGMPAAGMRFRNVRS